MKILVRLPNWLGDTVMATPAIELLFEHFSDATFSFVGSSVSIELFKRDKRVANLFVDDSKNSSFRLLALYKLAKKVGEHDIAITFQNTLLSALFLFFSSSKVRIGTKKELRSLFLTHSFEYKKNLHQVERYFELVREYLKIDKEPGELKLIANKKEYPQKRAGLAIGASYGEAKVWDPLKYAELAIKLSNTHQIVILGSKKDVKNANLVEKSLNEAHITNYQNLCGKTTISELVDEIASLDLLVCNDSGPMHIAAAFKIPTVAIFGPTDEKETSQWNNPNGIIVKKQLSCAPCKKRKCPLGHHACMEEIGVDDVYKEIILLIK